MNEQPNAAYVAFLQIVIDELRSGRIKLSAKKGLNLQLDLKGTHQELNRLLKHLHAEYARTCIARRFPQGSGYTLISDLGLLELTAAKGVL